MKTKDKHLTFLVMKAGLIAALKTYELSVKYERPDLRKDAQRIVEAVKTGGTREILSSVLDAGK